MHAMHKCNTVVGGQAAYVDPNSFPELVQRNSIVTLMRLLGFIVLGWFAWRFVHGQPISWWPLLVCLVAIVSVPHVSISHHCVISKDNPYFQQFLDSTSSPKH